jgi:hypothetical protein
MKKRKFQLYWTMKTNWEGNYRQNQEPQLLNQKT